MFEKARKTIQKSTRRSLALYFGSVNLAGETVTHPSKMLKGIERRGERVLKQIEANNRQIRRSVSLLRSRTTETANNVRGTARASAGLATRIANDATAPVRSTRRRPTSRKPASRKTAVARQSSQAELKKTRTVAKASETRARKQTRTTLGRAQTNVQNGLHAVGQQLENAGDRIERAVEQVTS